MGLEIERAEFDDTSIRTFRRRLSDNLAALAEVMSRPTFGTGPASLGAELELYLVDGDGRPLPRNAELLEACADPRLTLELNRFNIEFNLSPVSAAGRPFSAIETEMHEALGLANRHAAELGGRAAAIGILPTLKRPDLGPQAMTDQNRYRALSEALKRMRGDRFAIAINGPDPLSLLAHEVTLEGANTSMQLHLKVAPKAFARLFNALQFLTPPVLAVSSNSPFLLGHRLWHETRVPLFKQSIDGRDAESRATHLPARVDFGHGWVRRDAYELFAHTVYVHEPILPICAEEDPLEVCAAGGTPGLYELRLHQGTCWPWNRPVFDPNGDGHLRIELRSLPAGPSPADMIANAAFAVGSAVGFAAQVEDMLPAMPFPIASQNFYRAAQFGIDAELMWPHRDDRRLERTPAVDIARALLPTAAAGLAELGVEEAESQHYLGIIEARLDARRTGALWQLAEVARHEPDLGRDRALARMLQRYLEYADANLPVAHWEIDP